MITEKRTRELFEYDATNGGLRYRRSTRGRNPKKPGDAAGTVQPDGYLQVMVDKKKYYVHRLVWLLHHGVLPERPAHIVHGNGDRSDNRIENLQMVSHSQLIQDAMDRSYEYQSHGLPEWMK